MLFCFVKCDVVLFVIVVKYGVVCVWLISMLVVLGLLGELGELFVWCVNVVIVLIGCVFLLVSVELS